jgi:phosphotriesterase-related protein
MGAAVTPANPVKTSVPTATGSVAPSLLGTTLIHEHVLVDFVGADRVSPSRYNRDEVFRVALPKLQEVRRRGCRTLVECTPAYLGRDPELLRRLSKASGVLVLTNTGYYGAARDKHLPKHAFEETPEQLAQRWVREAQDGIDGTGIRPAFQKLGVDAGPLSAVDRKLIEAGCLTWQQTGLRMHVHTGNGEAALGILEVLKQRGVPARAYVWVHAQNERDREIHRRLGAEGAFLEFDGINERSLDRHLAAVLDLWKAGFANQLLISQDSGWYHVGEPGGGNYRGYTFLFDAFLPALRRARMTEADLRRLLVLNPRTVFAG